ncbi:ABC transporter permease [Halobacillus locisalis]|uniref:ABC transporter permease n=1 Tax=Halobacillus locisalis TaxID=220753 RepID=A0A838CUC2_9BACI|nr:ABC transporter permease subunit [Halobacillus locisalis]MBA2175226.1 ABC transporter permease [Halobacillus locisalis]
MKIIKFLLYYVLGLLGITVISAMPGLFTGGSFFNVSAFLSSWQGVMAALVQPSEWVYLFKGDPQPLIPYLWEPYTYSMTIFFAGILLGFGLAFLFAFGTMFLPKWAKQLLGQVLNTLESVPDLLLAFSMQLLVVWLYKQSNVIFLDFATVGQDKIYILPIITIAVLPLAMMYKIMLMLMDEEMTKSYVQMAKSKGMEKSVILNVHVVRNLVKSVFYNSKLMIWSTLSSLLIVEYIFNMNGITWAFLMDPRPLVTSFVLFMLFTPFFLIYQGTETFLFSDPKASDQLNTKMNQFMGSGMSSRKRNGLKYAVVEILAHFKNLKFLIGFLVITSMLVISFVYTATADPLIEKFTLVYEDDKLVSAPPHSPEFVFLGSDPVGFSILDQLLVGAKYTILFALAVAFLRMFVGFILAIPFAFFFPPKLQRFVEKGVDGMYFLPLTIVAYILLQPVLKMPMSGFETTVTERILYQGIILVLLVLPLVMTLFGNEMKLLMQEEYVVSSKVLGGSSVHLLWKHLLPHLSTRMGIVFGQQFIQTLLILIHLGVFKLFFGGTIIKPLDPPRSVTNEWSGIIGSSKDALMTGNWWYIIPALLCFMVLILSMQLIISGIKEVQQIRVGVPVERSTWWRKLLPNRTTQRYKPDVAPEPNDFVFTQGYPEERRKQG